MTAALTFTETLTVKTCPVCFIRYAAPEGMFTRIDERGGSWYCPQGHSLHFTKTQLKQAQERAESLERSLKYERTRNVALTDQKEATERSLRATKGVLTKTRKRIHNGVCPHCHRTFKDVAAHMQSRHAAEVAKDR